MLDMKVKFISLIIGAYETIPEVAEMRLEIWGKIEIFQTVAFAHGRGIFQGPCATWSRVLVNEVVRGVVSADYQDV